MASYRLLAHEYYVLPQARISQVYSKPYDIFLPLQDPFYVQLLLVLALMTLGVMAILLVLPHFRKTRLMIAFIQSKLAPQALPFIRIVMGITLLAASFAHTLFGPEIGVKSLPMFMSIEPILFTVGLCFILGIATSFTALVALLIFIDAVIIKGPYMLTYAYVLGVLLSYISKYIFNLSNSAKLSLIRIGLGVSLLYTAIDIKLMHPAMTLATLNDFHLASYLPFDPLFIVLGAFIIEAALGLCLIAGLFVRSASFLTLVAYTASIFFFRSESLWPHILPMAICLSLMFGHMPALSLDRILDRFVQWFFKIHPPTPFKTIVLGGGFGGISAALELSALAGKGADITLVSDTEYHALHPAFYETATYEQPRRSVAIPLASIFRSTGVKLKIGSVEQINKADKEIILKNNDRLKYDKLVVAIGSESNDFNTPGVKDYGIPLKTLTEAMEIQTRIRQLFETACNEESCQPIHIVIGGGGFTGVELAGEVIRYAHKLQEQFCVPEELVHIHLVHSQPRILSGLDEKIGISAERRLAGLGIDMVLGSRIASVGRSFITLKDERKIPCSLLIWTAGIKGCSVVATSGLEVDKENHIYVNEYLQAKNDTDVYVCGDAAAYQLPGSDPAKPQFAPAVAQVAKEQGRTVGRNIFYEMTHEPLERYRYRHMGYIIPVSGKYAYAHLQHLSFSGFAAYLLQQFIILQWLLVILPLPAALVRFDTFAMELFSED